MPAEGRMHPVGLPAPRRLSASRLCTPEPYPLGFSRQLPRPRPRCPDKAAQAQVLPREITAWGFQAAQGQETKGV